MSAQITTQTQHAIDCEYECDTSETFKQDKFIAVTQSQHCEKWLCVILTTHHKYTPSPFGRNFSNCLGSFLPELQLMNAVANTQMLCYVVCIGYLYFGCLKPAYDHAHKSSIPLMTINNSLTLHAINGLNNMSLSMHPQYNIY